jgi:hypothetical protein
MCDIHIAAQTPNRLATRGSLHSLFASDAEQPVDRADLPALTGDLEAYEQSRDPRLARQVVKGQRVLFSSPEPLDVSLADAVEQHYRNANVRIAITAEMLNRLVGQQRSEMRPVRDRIAGTPVRGQSHSHSESRVRLEPATGRWQMDVQSQGVVESDTLANGGRARLRSVGATQFSAEKSIVVDENGVRLNATTVGATNHNRLVGVRTQFDWVPLFGEFARNRAVEQFKAKRPRAKAEVEARVAAEAIDRLDRDAHSAVQRVEQQFRDEFARPIAEFGIDITPIELTTTEDRLVARLRVAGNHQLGSHTPRPRALSDSLASVQLHETALTNAAISLALDGGRFTAPQLQATLRAKFPRMAIENPADARQETVFEFAYRDAVQFRIDGGRLELLLGLSGFEHQGRRSSDFVVHAIYVPVVNGLNAELIRSGPLGIEGRLGSADRARLHNAFNTVLAEDRPIPIVRRNEVTDPRLNGLMITQCVLEDGWIGLALGPVSRGRVAERSRELR